MYTRIQIVFDAAEPLRLADFWGLALGYVTESPPPGFATWEDFARSINLPEEKWGDQASVVDPSGPGPRIFFQRVPEGEVGQEPRAPRRASRHRPQGCGARPNGSRRTSPGSLQAGASSPGTTHNQLGETVVMRDPEGNEFCVC